MRFCIVIFIMCVINLGEGGYWEQIRSLTKPYKGRTILGKEMLNKLKNNLKRTQELPKSRELRQGPLKSLYLQSGNRYFPFGGGTRAGDRERKIDGDMNHRRRRPPAIMPLQYRRGGGRTRTPMRKPGDPDPPIWTPTTTTEAPITTTTSCSKKRTKFDYKAHFDSRAWGRTNASTLPRTPKRTIYRHYTPDIIGTGERQWTLFTEYTDNEWRIMPIWEEGSTPTDHYLELPTNVPNTDYGDVYDIGLVVNYTNYSLVTNATEAPPETPKTTLAANVTAANFTAANVTTANVTAANVTAPNATTPNTTIVTTPTLTTRKCKFIVLNVPLPKNKTGKASSGGKAMRTQAESTTAESTTAESTTVESTTAEVTIAADPTAEDAEKSTTPEVPTAKNAAAANATAASTTTTEKTKPPEYFTIAPNGTVPENGTILDGYISYVYCLEDLHTTEQNSITLDEEAKQALLDIWSTKPPKKKTHKRTTKQPLTRAANETSAEKISYLSTIKTRSTPFKRFTDQATWYEAYKDYIHEHDKRRVQRLSSDLLRDAIHKIQQVTTIKDECMYATAFEVGYVIGVIREKYRRMMATYTEIMDRVRSRTRMLSANNDFHMIRTYHVLIYYEWLHNLEKDIDYLLDALEAIPFEEIGATEATISFRAKAQDEMEAREIMSRRAQEKLKSQYRQEYLMRRLGLPRNMSTARRRFYNKWPVEDTWDHTPQYWMDGENRRGSL